MPVQEKTTQDMAMSLITGVSVKPETEEEIRQSSENSNQDSPQFKQILSIIQEPTPQTPQPEVVPEVVPEVESKIPQQSRVEIPLNVETSSEEEEEDWPLQPEPEVRSELKLPNLPFLVHRKIASYLNAQEVLNYGLTCKRLYRDVIGGPAGNGPIGNNQRVKFRKTLLHDLTEQQDPSYFNRIRVSEYNNVLRVLTDTHHVSYDDEGTVQGSDYQHKYIVKYRDDVYVHSDDVIIKRAATAQEKAPWREVRGLISPEADITVVHGDFLMIHYYDSFRGMEVVRMSDMATMSTPDARILNGFRYSVIKGEFPLVYLADTRKRVLARCDILSGELREMDYSHRFKEFKTELGHFKLTYTRDDDLRVSYQNLGTQSFRDKHLLHVRENRLVYLDMKLNQIFMMEVFSSSSN